MARKATHRREIRGRLCAESPILIGGSATPGADVTPLRDGVDRIIIPGTSLAGVLRHWAMDSAQHRAGVDTLFGDSRPDSSEGTGASPLVIFDLVAEQSPHQVIRDGVGIDRISGTAAEHVKFDQTVLDVGTSFKLEMRVEYTVADGGTDPEAIRLLNEVVAALTQGWIRLGRGTTRSLGRVQLCEPEQRTLDLTDREQVLALALGRDLDSGDARWSGLNAESKGGRQAHRLEMTWRPTTPVMSAESLADGAVDLIPRTIVRSVEGSDSLHLVLPGTSIKGVLRSTAEFIMRSLRGESAPAGFLEQLEYPPIAALFGSTGRRSAISVDDVCSTAVFSLSADLDDDKRLLRRWEEALADRATDASRLVKLRKRLNELAKDSEENSKGQKRTGRLIPSARVAINRWTSAPVDGALYSILEPHGFDWDAIAIEIDLSMVQPPWNPESVAALLLLVLDRIDDQQVSLGFGGQRGLGGFVVDAIVPETPSRTESGDEPGSNDLFERVMTRRSGSGASLTSLSDEDREILSNALSQVVSHEWEAS